jgi:hypothetical protein
LGTGVVPALVPVLPLLLLEAELEDEAAEEVEEAAVEVEEEPVDEEEEEEEPGAVLATVVWGKVELGGGVLVAAEGFFNSYTITA